MKRNIVLTTLMTLIVSASVSAGPLAGQFIDTINAKGKLFRLALLHNLTENLKKVAEELALEPEENLKNFENNLLDLIPNKEEAKKKWDSVFQDALSNPKIIAAIIDAKNKAQQAESQDEDLGEVLPSAPIAMSQKDSWLNKPEADRVTEDDSGFYLDKALIPQPSPIFDQRFPVQLIQKLNPVVEDDDVWGEQGLTQQMLGLNTKDTDKISDIEKQFFSLVKDPSIANQVKGFFKVARQFERYHTSYDWNKMARIYNDFFQQHKTAWNEDTDIALGTVSDIMRDLFYKNAYNFEEAKYNNMNDDIDNINQYRSLNYHI